MYMRIDETRLCMTLLYGGVTFGYTWGHYRTAGRKENAKYFLNPTNKSN